MFQRRLQIDILGPDGPRLCPLRGLDSFAMRNFTNDAVFDDTLPIADGLMEAGNRVPLDRLRDALQDWLRRKSFLTERELVRVSEIV